MLISIIESTGVERVKEHRLGREEKGEDRVEGKAKGGRGNGPDERGITLFLQLLKDHGF